MHAKGSKAGTEGASGYAPGHQTTGSNTGSVSRDRDDMPTKR
jgi:hypothetical protein